MKPDIARKLMVERHIRARGVRDPRVLAALGTVYVKRSYPRISRSMPLPIEADQTISQPYTSR